MPLFLTSKVRLHCDDIYNEGIARSWNPFPDLKGQAPLRPAGKGGHVYFPNLFLTSKVRLHCDGAPSGGSLDRRCAFPDLKGQAPLRPVDFDQVEFPDDAFPDLKGQAPLRRVDNEGHIRGGELFLTSKVRLHCDIFSVSSSGMRSSPFS